MRMPTAYFLTTLMLLCSLTGCSQIKKDSALNQTSDLKGSWALTKIGEADAVPGTTIVFMENDKSNGYSGCNNYQTSYTWKGTVFSIKEPTTTERACNERAKMDQEGAYYKAFSKINAASVEGDQLTLKGSEATLVFKRSN